MTDTCSGDHNVDVSSVCFPKVPLIVTVRHRALTNVADNLEVFVLMKTKSRAGSNLVVIENDEIPDRLVSRVDVRSDHQRMLCFEPARIHTADVIERF